MDVSKYKALYLQEAREHLSGIEQSLLCLEKEPTGPEVRSTVDNLFRHYHTIKGMSASMGYEPIQRFSHAQEDLLDKIRSGKLDLNDSIISILIECLDGLSSLVDRVETDTPLDQDITHLLAKIQAAIDAPNEATPAEKPSGPSVQDGSGTETTHKAIKEMESPSSPEFRAREGQGPELKLSNVMKVEGAVFDNLLAGVGDLFMALSSIKSLSADSGSIALKDEVHLLGKSVNRLHASILEARMLPLADLTEGLPRVVRDISKRSGKEVDLKVEGADLKLDRSILENLGSPLVHIIRNAMDHGIDSVDERNRAGKPPRGTISIRAVQRKDHVVIVVSDDGKGIDVEEVRRKAVDKGVPQERVCSMTDKEALLLVCMPGLSSAREVTDTSGRGVGMDVVKDTIEGLGGRLDIESIPGKGTKIILKLPRSSSIIKVLSVTVSGERFLLPLSKIDRVLELHRTEIFGSTIFVDGIDVPLVSLAEIFGLRKKDIASETATVVLTEAEPQAPDSSNNGGEGPDKRLLGLMVDDFGDEIDAYIKPLTPPISRLWGVSGITVMGDGRIVFLLDIAQITAKILPA